MIIFNKNKIMKKLLIIFLTFVLVSCSKNYTEGPIQYKTKIIEKFHKDSSTEYGMHYGYSPIKGKMSYHMGSYTEYEKNIVTFMFFDDTISQNDKELYEKSGDSLYLYYEKKYHIKKDDTIFVKNSIIEINTQ